MKRGFTLLATGLGLLASGCVSTSRFEDLKAREQELAWRVEVAEKATVKSEAERRLACREMELAKEDSRVYRERLALANEALKEARREVDDELKQRLEELQAKAPGKLELSPWGGIVLESGILFAPGRHELTKEGEKALTPLMESLTSPKYEGFQVELSGHTDSDPLRATAKVYADNHELSAKRANSVRRFLVGKGVPANRIYLSAWGETRALANETTAEGKASNRRVEIRLHHDQNTVELRGSVRPGNDSTKPASSPKTNETKIETPEGEAPADPEFPEDTDESSE